MDINKNGSQATASPWLLHDYLYLTYSKERFFFIYKYKYLVFTVTLDQTYNRTACRPFNLYDKSSGTRK